MGMITGISGGMLRDIPTARMPLLFWSGILCHTSDFRLYIFVLFNG